MATVKPFIRTIKKNIDINVRFRLSDGEGVQLFYNSDIIVRSSQFDNSTGCVKTRIVMDDEHRRTIDDKIAEVRSAILLAYRDRKQTDIVDAEWLKFKVDQLLAHNQIEVTKSFFDLYDVFMQQLQVCVIRGRHYSSTLRLLRRFELYMKRRNPMFSLEISTLNPDIWYSLLDYIQNEANILSSGNVGGEVISNRSLNTTSCIWKRVKAFMNWAVINGYSTNVSHKLVKAKTEIYATPYYLTQEERNNIYLHDFSEHPSLEIQRDIFIFHCLIGCRVGDLVELTKNSIIGRAVEYVANKNMNKGANVIRVPLNEIALVIVKKYSNTEGNKLLPFISPQKYNDAIKEIFNTIGINRKVTVINKQGKEEKTPINELASSHLARRTFIGNLYKKVKDPNLIGSLSGHSEGSRAFTRYREIDEDIKRELIDLL